MEYNLKEQLMNFYHCKSFLETGTLELDELERNPLIYNESTDITHLQQVLDYHTETTTLRNNLRCAQRQLTTSTNDIIDLLTTIGVPIHKKIPIHNTDYTKLYFWYDEDGCVDYEVAI